MFVRKKVNKSGVISIQVIDKSSGKYKVLKTIGSSSDNSEIELLYKSGLSWIDNYAGQKAIDFSNKENIYYEFIKDIQQVNVIGPELLLGKLFKEIGFDQVKGVLFKHLVIARLCYPASKLKTTDYLKKYQSIEINEDAIYRYLDQLQDTQKDLVSQISYEHTLKILNNNISVVFYDVTTLYFEINNEDDLRKTGFSKDGKHQHPQIVLGLLVSVDGYPLAYDIFEGNKYEGYTMLPIIDQFKVKFKLTELVVVADSGLMSKANVDELQAKGYKYILGARIKNENKNMKEEILSIKLKNGENKIIEKDKNTRLIISYSDKRAKKDKYNRERGLKRLESNIKSGRLTKSNINNRGYNKYLKLDGDVKISIDKTKFEADSKWDGLKGYITNTNLGKDMVIENYKHLWKIEKAFRISKNDLKIRPIYHRLQKRIEAHITIAFASYKLHKELERQLKVLNVNISPEKAIDIAKTIYAINVKVSDDKIINQPLILNEEQRNLCNIFNLI